MTTIDWEYEKNRFDGYPDTPPATRNEMESRYRPPYNGSPPLVSFGGAYFFVDEPSFKKEPFRVYASTFSSKSSQFKWRPLVNVVSVDSKGYPVFKIDFDEQLFKLAMTEKADIKFFKPKREKSATEYEYVETGRHASGSFIIDRTRLGASLRSYDGGSSVVCRMGNLDTVKKYLADIKAAQDEKIQSEKDKAQQNKF
ncbi:MAG: hypothetical protein LBE50_02945 [Gallionellaceae bacterium]|nr:hypothetical protein [Gallionellaceae bacterium]